MTTLRFPAVDEPLVSIVMVTYGSWPLARRSLEAVVAHTDGVYEVIVVDNASPDDTPERLREEVEGATLLFNEVNTGFGAASNRGADEARGRYLCFLNSDAYVEEGWLPPLLQVFEDDPTAGASVPMLLNPDGTIQEAGSIVDSVGWAMALGSDESPDALEHRFRRSVDFASAACMLVERSTFLEVGGFDPVYGVGYFEDVDLCFKLRERGLRTIYEPRSRVVHERHGSGTSDLARQRMQTNRQIFYARWTEQLAQRPRLLEVANSRRRRIAARDVDALDRVLVFDDRVPFRDRGSGDPRMYKLLEQLAELWPAARITLAAADGREAARYAEPLLDLGIEVVCPPVDWEHWFKSRFFHYSAVITSRGQNVERFEGHLDRTQPQAMRAFDTEALSFRRYERMAEHAHDPAQKAELGRMAAHMRGIEIRALQESAVVFAVSEEEAAYIAQIAPGTPTFTLPSYVEPLEQAPGFDERRDIVFFGGFLAGPGSPNEDALLHLVAEVMPLLWELEPELVLHVVGADPTPAVEALHGERINVVGYVEDPTEWLAKTRVHVSPMRFGAGIRLRLLDTMAAGLPFVTSAVGAEGLPLGALRPRLVAEAPDEQAQLVHALYTDPVLWEEAQSELLSIIRSRFDLGTFRRELVRGMSHLGLAPPADAFAA
jgi:O-antigen biosynthesis protein